MNIQQGGPKKRFFAKSLLPGQIGVRLGPKSLVIFFQIFQNFFRVPTRPLKLKLRGFLYEKIKIVVETSNLAQNVGNVVRIKLYKTTQGLNTSFVGQNFEIDILGVKIWSIDKKSKSSLRLPNELKMQVIFPESNFVKQHGV